MAPIVYSREQLLSLRNTAVRPEERPEIPRELRRRTRGCRAGTRRRESRRAFRPTLPSIVMGNVRSLPNKMDELAALTRYQHEFRRCSMLVFSESWLREEHTDSSLHLDGFSLIRADRTERSGKRKGGGLAVFVNDRWCNSRHITIKVRHCCPDIELLAVGLRPFYLPREFSHAIVVAVYVPPSANAEAACDVIGTVINRLQTQSPQALLLISGDFNHASLSSTLPKFIQYVTCATRDNKTLDLFYANTKEAYKSSPLPPLGKADHNLVHLLPVYQPLFNRQPAVTRTVKRWSDEAEEALRDCFETTVWDVFSDSHGEDIDSLTDSITDYINFCVENTVPTRTVRCFSNNKPWITPGIKALLKEKKRAFRSGNREELKTVQRELRRKIREEKDRYRRKMEEQLQDRNTRDVWRGLKTISGHQETKSQSAGDKEWADELNTYFCRFEDKSAPPPAVAALQQPPGPCPRPLTSPLPLLTLPPTASSSPLPLPPTVSSSPLPLSTLPPPVSSSPLLTLPPTVPRPPPPAPPLPLFPSLPSASSSSPPTTPPAAQPSSPSPPLDTQPPCSSLSLSPLQVGNQLRRIKARKATGPDGLSPRLLRSCSGQLSGIIGHLFNLSLRLGRVPRIWKTSCVVPVPKTPHPKDPSCYRPVALTSHLMKALERLVLAHLRPLVSSSMDPLQFAYQAGIGVDDAIIFLLHRALTHLELPGSSVRVLFLDLSSAFNTIRPDILRDKLELSGVDQLLTCWIVDYLTDRPQYVRTRDCVSERALCSIGAPQGTVLAPFLFTLYTADFSHLSPTCHLQKFSDDSAIVGLITDGDDSSYRGLIRDFVDWCQRNHLQINSGKTKELVVDFRRRRHSPPSPVNIQGRDIEMVTSFKYLGVYLNHKLDWTHNTTALFKKGQSRLYLLRRLRSFGVRGALLKTFYDSVVASAVFYGVVCWGSSITAADRKRLDKLIRKSSSVLGCPLDSVEEVVERRTTAKLSSMLDRDSHPLHHTLTALRSSVRDRMLHPKCVTERYRRSFLPAAVRLYNKNL